MYTFNNLEAIKNKFDNEIVKHPKKIHLKKRITKVNSLDFKRTPFPNKKDTKPKKIRQEEEEE
jgi:hypothetical protein